MLKVDAKSGEIFVYDVIGSDMFGNGIMAQDVIDALDKLGSTHATVRINSPGGSVDEGISIYNALKRHAAGVTTVIDSLAASIASIIALAGDKRIASEGSRWMIHQASTIAWGNATEMRKVADMLAIHDSSLMEIYAKHMKASAEEIQAMLAAETWFTAQQSVDAGLATDYSGAKSDQKPKLAAWMKNLPTDLIEQEKRHNNIARIASLTKCKTKCLTR